MTEWLSCLDEEGMAQLVTLFKMYLSAHFTTRPVGLTHPAICAVKGLDILYQANNIGTQREQERQRRSAIQDAKDGKQPTVATETTSTISYKYFYSGVMEALKFRDEYQIWREGWDAEPKSLLSEKPGPGDVHLTVDGVQKELDFEKIFAPANDSTSPAARDMIDNSWVDKAEASLK